MTGQQRRQPPKRKRTGTLFGSILVAAVAAVFAAVALCDTLPDGVEPVAWDREPCAHCRMHVGDPSFAAQLQTTDGRVMNFDDPGCYFEYVEQNQPPVHAAYFHHHHEDRWLPAAQTAFTRVRESPMGYGLAAVDTGTPGALALDEARTGVLARKGGR